MGAIFGLLGGAGQPLEPAARERAARTAARFGRDGLHLWHRDAAYLGRAVNLVRPRASPQATGLPAGLDHLHGVASARLDNRPDLLARFGLPDDVPDLTLILLAYATWGTDCPAHLRGDFALAIWDTAAGRLFCARDRAGMRPLYYRHGRDGFLFASALPILAALAGTRGELDDGIWAAHFARRPIAPEDCHWRGVQRLPPACAITVEGGRTRQRRYWTPIARHPGCRSEAEWAEAGRAVLGAAVASQGADCGVAGLMLSGGLDSSFILGLALADRGAASVRAATSVLPAGHPGPERDEREQLELLRRHFPGLAVEEVVPEATDPLGTETWADLWASQGRPENLFHPMDRELSARLAGQGARVVYSGFWGDGGLSYRGRGWASARLRRGDWLSAWHGAVRVCAGEDRSPARELLGEARFALPAQFHRGGGPDQARFLSPGLRVRLPRQSPGRAAGTPWRLLPEIMAGGFATVEEQVLTAAAEGVDLAFPYLAPEMVEFILAVPPEIYVSGGWRRGLARVAMAGLVPEAIRLRTDKQAYLPAFSRGIRDHWTCYRQELADCLADPDTRGYLGHYLDLAQLRNQLMLPPPTGTGFGREGQVIQAAMAISAMRFLVWARAHLGPDPA